MPIPRCPYHKDNVVWYGYRSLYRDPIPYHVAHTILQIIPRCNKPMIATEKIEAIKSAAEILDVVSDFVILKKRGSQYFGLSPFSEERTPSFTVNPSKQIFKDFSSGKGGNVIEFLMQKCSFKYYQAIQYLGKKYNIDVDIDDTYVYVPTARREHPVLPTSFIHPNVLLDTLKGYETNALFKFLHASCDTEKLTANFKRYYVGIDQSNEYTKDWVIFWQVDCDTMVRSGKLVKYNPDGHRSKEHAAGWVHSMRRNNIPLYPDFNLKQCFFGEHLLSEDVRKPVAIVESEKTALICSLLIPNYFWLACGSKFGLNADKCAVLKNKSVTLFPDLDAHEEWKGKAKELNFNVSEHINKIATDQDRNNKLDIADFLLR